MKFHLLSSLLVLVLVSLQCYPQVTVLIGKSNETIYPITPNETTDLTDLIPLETLFKNKQVIGMGEATHGTKEFFNTKAKMFKFLVTHCGYTVFSIEATYGGTLKVNDYVLYGKGDVLTVMKSMEFWTWDTEEVKDLIEWMKSYNDGKHDNEKLKFYGFDCQSFKGPTNALVDYVKEVDKQNVDKFLKGLSVLNDSSYLYFYSLNSDKSSQGRIAQIHEIITFIQQWFQENENFYISSSGRTKFELARYNIENLNQTLFLRGSPEQKYGLLRDSLMAHNIKWILEQEQEKVFVWAHNGHIGKTLSFDKQGACMGMYLDRWFGHGYYNIGFVFNEGSFQAITKTTGKPAEFTVPEYNKNTLTNALVNSCPDAFFIDLTNSNNKLFRSSRRTYYIGAAFIQEYWSRYSKSITAKNQFNGLIFIHTTSRAVPINRKKTN